MLKPISILAALFLTFGAREAAAEFRLATVDLNRVMNESAGSKDQRKALDELSAQAKKKIQAKQSSLSAMEKKLKDSNATEDSKEARQFKTEVRDFNLFVKDTEDDFKREFMKINKVLTEKAVSAVREYAKAEKIDLVVDRSEQVKGPVLFGNPSVDITEAIIKKLN